MRLERITTQAQVRAGFWEAHPQFASEYRASKRQNQYRTNIRVSFVEYVDSLARSGNISERLASRVNL